MRRGILSLTILAASAVLNAFSCSKAPLPTELETEEKKPIVGKLFVYASDENGKTVDSADVYLNGEFIGWTPVSKDSVVLGIHVLRVQKEGFRIFRENLVIEDTNRVFVEALLEPMPVNEGQLLVTVDQDSAIITVSDANHETISKLQARELALILSPGGYFIKVEKAGFLAALKALEVQAGKVTVENIHLEKLPDTTLPQIVLIVPDSGKVNEPVLISWQSYRANRVDVDYVQNPGLSGRREITFTTPGVRIIQATAYNNAGQTSVKDSVRIYRESLPPANPPTIKVDVTPDTAQVNEVINISWYSQYATSVYVDYVPNPGPMGQWQTSFSAPGLYTISAHAYGPGGEAHDADTVVVTNQPLPPTPTVDISANPSSIVRGQSSTLSWSSTNAYSARIDQGIGEVTLSGIKVVQPSTTTTYRIEVTGLGGTAWDTTTVVVTNAPPSPAPTVDISADPHIITRGQSSTLSWSSTNASSAQIDQGIGEVTLNGSLVVQPNITTTYRIEVQGAGGAAWDTTTVVVRESPPANPPTLEFTVSPDSVDFGQPVFLNWNSDGYQVVIDQGIGVRGPTGSEEKIPLDPGKKIFTCVAYGQGNLTTVRQDSVYVREPTIPSLPVIILSVTDSAQVGSPVTVEWHSWYADRVDVDYIQNPGLSGRREIVFNTPGQRVISATAYNQAGQVSSSDTLIVVEVPPSKPTVEPIIIPSTTIVVASPFGQSVDESAGQANISVAGYYKVTATIWYNSGDEQKNESLFLLVANSDGVLRAPQDPNAGPYKVVPDDPGPPHVADREAGVFFFNQGINSIQAHHYSTIADIYPQFLVNPPITGPESVHLVAFKLEFLSQ